MVGETCSSWGDSSGLARPAPGGPAPGGQTPGGQTRLAPRRRRQIGDTGEHGPAESSDRAGDQMPDGQTGRQRVLAGGQASGQRVLAGARDGGPALGGEAIGRGGGPVGCGSGRAPNGSPGDSSGHGQEIGLDGTDPGEPDGGATGGGPDDGLEDGPGGPGSGGASGGDSGRARLIPPRLYRISDIVDYSGVSRQTIHNYTTMGLIRETRRTPGGHRLYDETVFARLDRIADLRRQSLSLREIRLRVNSPLPEAI